MDNKKDYIYNCYLQKNMEQEGCACFNEVANGLVIHYNNVQNNFLNEYYRRRIEEIDNKILDIRALRKNKSEACKLLENTQNECMQLISDIHKESLSPDI